MGIFFIYAHFLRTATRISNKSYMCAVKRKAASSSKTKLPITNLHGIVTQKTRIFTITT